MRAAPDLSVGNRLYRSIEALPADLLACLAYAPVAIVLLLLDTPLTPLRPVIAFPLVIFLPGYLLLAAIFPGEPRDATPAMDAIAPQLSRARRTGIDGVERVALSFVASVGAIGFIGYGMTLLGVPLGTVPVVQVLALSLSVGLVVASIRRLSVPADRRFGPSTGRLRTRLYRRFVGDQSAVGMATNVTLVVLVLAASGTLVLGVPGADNGDAYSDLRVVTADGNGSYTAEGYPETVVSGDSVSLSVGVHNAEGQTVDYTVAAQLQRVAQTDGELSVRDRRSLGTESLRVADGETEYWNHTFTPRTTGEDLRIVYLLYEGAPPTNPRIGNAYRHVHVWTNVTAAPDEPP